MAHFYPVWIEQSDPNTEPRPSIIPQRGKTDKVMMSQGKTILKLA